MNNLISMEHQKELEDRGLYEGVLCLSNWGGLVIYEVVNGESVVMRAEYGQDEPERMRWYWIHWTASGRPYVNYRGHRYHLDEFTRNWTW